MTEDKVKKNSITAYPPVVGPANKEGPYRMLPLVISSILLQIHPHSYRTQHNCSLVFTGNIISDPAADTETAKRRN